MYTNYTPLINSIDTFVETKESSIFSTGGEVVVPASGETAEDIAIASCVDLPGVILGGDLNIIKPNATINPLFLALAISNGALHFDLAKKAQGKSVVHVHNEDIAGLTLKYANLNEQERISNFVIKLGELITLHQRKDYGLKWVQIDVFSCEVGL